MKVLITIIRPEKVASMQEKGNVAHQAEFTIQIEHIQKNKVATSTTQTCNQRAAHLCPYLSPITPFVKSCQSPDCEASAILAKQPTKYIAFLTVKTTQAQCSNSTPVKAGTFQFCIFK
jgi:hypothetical protein